MATNTRPISFSRNTQHHQPQRRLTQDTVDFALPARVPNRRRQHATCPLDFTAHARKRQAQRNIPPELVDYILQWGTVLQRTGVTFVVLRHKDIVTIPPADRVPNIEKLNGLVVFLDRFSRVITCYHDPEAFRVICKKPKRSA